MSTQTYDEAKHPRGEAGKFATKPASESQADLDDRDTEPGHYAGKPFMATVQPEAWINDNAIETGPEVEFDIAHALHSYDQDTRDMILYEAESGMAADHDYLYQQAAERGDVQDGYGPYTVHLDADQLREWMADNPPWVQDGTTPHPTGGYVTIEDNDSYHEQVRSYRDADGKHHRTDGPAFIKEDDTGVMEQHYRHGVLHNEAGPAQVILGRTSSSKTWYVDGQRAGTHTETSEHGWEIVDGLPVRSED